MCGRYTLLTESYDFGDWFGLAPPTWLVSRYNIAPSYDGTGAPAIIRLDSAGQREIVRARWWFIPAWWSRPLKELPTTFNARAEEVQSKRFFKDAFERRRCLVPASGWYEFRGAPKHKESHYFHLPANAPLAFGGVWETWISKVGEVVDSFAIITTDPNDVARPIHDRMPLVIPKESYATWLSADPAGQDAATQLMRPLAQPVEVYEASGYGNDPRHEGPECLKPTPILKLF